MLYWVLQRWYNNLLSLINEKRKNTETIVIIIDDDEHY